MNHAPPSSELITPDNTNSDLRIAEEIDHKLATARLNFDGYKLLWKENGNNSEYAAFSGKSDESARESVQDIGPTPQGLFAIEPANIENLRLTDDWGNHRVKLEPYAKTVDRMTTCFKLVRTGMYIHGGSQKGTHGCIEINDDTEETSFFDKLRAYGKRIELEVKYTGDRERKYEETACPY